jgi:hypothetical protein
MRLEIDVRQLQRKLDGLSARNIRYATANAVNATAKRVQQEARRNVAEFFTLRDSTRQFMEKQAAVIKPFAKPTDPNPFADVAVGQAKRLLLSEFEEGAPRKPFTPGAKSVAVPITGSAARPTFAARVPAALQLKNLRLKPQLNAAQRREFRQATKGVQGRSRAQFIAANKQLLGIADAPIAGKERTFVIRGVGVFQRTGAKDARLLYKYVPDGQLRPTLRFLATAKVKGRAFLVEEMQRAIANEIRLNEARARARGS